MAVPWLATLPKAASLFYTTALSGVSKGLAANTILKAYSVAGPGIRRSLGLEVVRMVRGIERSARAFRSLKMDLFPDPARIPVARHKLFDNYSYNVGFKGLSSEGKAFSGNVTVVTPEVITRRQAEEKAAEFLEKTPAEYGIEAVEQIGLEGIKKHPRLG